MRPYIFALLIAAVVISVFSLQDVSFKRTPRILILTKADFTVQESTPAGIEAIKKICRENGWKADVAEDPWGYFDERKIGTYAAIVFLNTAGDVLIPADEITLERYMEAGGGFVGIHTAIDAEHNWDWYGDLIGCRFAGTTRVQDATIRVQDGSHPSTRHLDSLWLHNDEWFNLSRVSPGLNVLLNVDEKTFEGGKMGVFHPVSWYHEFDGGRVFVTALGDSPAAYSNPAFLQHLAGGIEYAIGDNKPLALKKTRTRKIVPVTTGFVKTSLVCNLYEPMQMDMFPDGKILIAERRGDLKLFDQATREIKVAGHLDVFLENEEGLLGLAIDPQWEQNKWIYLYYAPLKGSSSIRLSRFEFAGDELKNDTEKVLLEVKTDRTTHNFHAAGTVMFDGEGYLWLSCGDNTETYPDGYAPIDERPGESQHDAQKSAANSMDLRGKILRIKPQPDGSYICPAGNLFAEEDVHVAAGGEVPAGKLGKGRPEIFVMGVRNPFRFEFDDRRKLLMWGEPGPDAGVDDPNRGNDGLDEFNWTRTPGFFGWPLFQGANEPYRDYDFDKNIPGPWFDPDHPVNDSPNNTGLKELPPARPAPVSYPFASSPEFPLFANGAKCAMGGPVYYTDEYPPDTRYPDRLNGKFFIYEWMRNWVLLLEIDSLDQFAGLEPFAPSIRLSRPMDMLIDKNGLLWVLEYGNEWYAQNPDACLTRIDYIRGEGGEEEIAGGNTTPRVRWDFFGKNRSFFNPGDQVRYKVDVTDTQDGSLESGSITADAVSVLIEYRDAASRPGSLGDSFKSSSPWARGKELVDGSDCKSCHAPDTKVIGPSYLELIAKYGNDKDAVPVLSKKIIDGGSGVWGDVAMAAHPQISMKEATEIVNWILSLKDPANMPLSVEGSWAFAAPPGAKGIPVYVFHAAYTDRGAGEHPPLKGAQTLVLRPSTMEAQHADTLSKNTRIATRAHSQPVKLVEMKHGSYLTFNRVDLTGVASLEISVDSPVAGSLVELHIGSPRGRLAGKAALQGPGMLLIPVDGSVLPVDGSLINLYLVTVNDKEPSKVLAAIDSIKFKI